MQEPKKSLGQHWLNDPASLQAMVTAADVQVGDVVLEVGPGQGSLTQVLLDAGAKVVAVELDDHLARTLPGKFIGQFASQRIELHHQSILDFDLTNLPTSYKLVANIPYYLTGKLLRQISESANPPVAAAILVQKEVAQRVCASPGQMSILAVTAQYYWQTSLGSVVPANLFEPPPKVDSQILILTRRSKPLFDDVDAKAYFRLVKAGFSNKRKTLTNSLAGGLGISKTEVERELTTANLNPTVRAQQLSLDDWHTLLQAIKLP